MKDGEEDRMWTSPWKYRCSTYWCVRSRVSEEEKRLPAALTLMSQDATRESVCSVPKFKHRKSVEKVSRRCSSEGFGCYLTVCPMEI